MRCDVRCERVKLRARILNLGSPSPCNSTYNSMFIRSYVVHVVGLVTLH